MPSYIPGKRRPREGVSSTDRTEGSVCEMVFSVEVMHSVKSGRSRGRGMTRHAQRTPVGIVASAQRTCFISESNSGVQDGTGDGTLWQNVHFRY